MFYVLGRNYFATFYIVTSVSTLDSSEYGTEVRTMLTRTPFGA